MKRPELFFYGTCGALVILMGWLTHYINARPLPDAVSVWDPAMADSLSKAYEAYASVNNLFTTLSTGLLAGLGLFLTNSHQERYTARSIWPAAASALCVCVALYWGYISSQNVEWAIESSVPTLDIPKLQAPRIIQGSAILIGVFFFGVFLTLDLTKGSAEGAAQHVHHS